MALRQIVLIGDEVLKEQSREVTAFDNRLATLIEDMTETMRRQNGVGLAAPQVGILKRVAVVDVGNGVIEMVNPVVIKESGTQVDNEGCLSIPGESAQILRPYKVTVSAFDRNGQKYTVKAEGYEARAICHEIDHLNGILYIDRIDETKEFLLKNNSKKPD